MSGGPVFRQLAYSTCSYLVNYPDAEGAAGRRLRPEVAAADCLRSRATAAPTRSGCGPASGSRRPRARRSRPRRSGSRSSGRASPAFAIGWPPELPPRSSWTMSWACPGFTSRAGVAHQGNQRSRRHDRLHPDTAGGRLHRPGSSSSDFCPVPIGTRAVEGGGSDSPIAMAGPYYVVSADNGRVGRRAESELQGDRPRRTARIVYTLGVDRGRGRLERRERARRLPQRGHDRERSERRAARTRRCARARVRAGEPRGTRGRGALRAEPAPLVDAIVLNTRRPLFHDARMRRAAAYALDRSALARVFGEQPSDRLVPPAVSGAGGSIAFPSEPDLAAARRLAGRGPRRAATLYYCGEPINGRIAEIVRSNLAEIGIDVRIDASLGCLTGPETRRLTGRRHAAGDELRRPVADPRRSSSCRSATAYSAPGYWNDTRPARADQERAQDCAEPRAWRPTRSSSGRWCAMPCRWWSSGAASTPSSSRRASAASCHRAPSTSSTSARSACAADQPPGAIVQV